MGEGQVNINGEYLEPTSARISFLDWGFLYGDGLFETLRTYRGKPFRLAQHLRRLDEGLRALQIRGGPSAEELTDRVEGVLERSQLPEAMIRITVSRGISSAGFDPSSCGRPTAVVA